ncbi:MAG: electron transfer flavoprotein beta subunit [Candidatus Endobugula sp.]|jgi:electron transfer flavoprotein beta subunit
MKILVAVKRVVDYNIKVRVNADNSGIDLTNTKMSINPFCEIAVEEALRLKEKGLADEVIVVSIGSKKCEEQLRYAMALGADRGILLETNSIPSSLYCAKLLSKVVEKENPGLIILGKQSIDSDNNQTGQMLAGLCGIAQGTFASKLIIEDNKVIVTREVDSGLQTLSLTLPAVITTDLRLNEPRYAKLPQIMKAKKKPLETLPAETLLAPIAPQVTTQRVDTPTQRKAGIKVANVEELINKLKNEAKVIS